MFQQFQQQKNNYLEIIYKGLVDNRSVSDIQKDLSKISGFKSVVLTNNTNKLLNRLKKAKTVYKDKDTEDIYKLLFVKLKAEHLLSKNQYQELNEFEAVEKDKIIEDTINEAREQHEIFYVCSAHDDSASDHVKFQGKIYVDSEWRSQIDDKELKKEISDFIERKNIKTFQWVVNAPVYMTTRPNCRHFFVPFTYEIVKNITNMKDFLEEHKMHFKSGYEAKVPTIRHSLNKQWYSGTNIKNIIAKYQERLSLHQALYKMTPTPSLKGAIEKDKLLIKKWQKTFDKFYRL